MTTKAQHEDLMGVDEMLKVDLHEPEVVITNLEKRFAVGRGPDDKVVHALHEVSLSVNRSEFVTVIGPSGCGKSTLLECIGSHHGR